LKKILSILSVLAGTAFIPSAAHAQTTGDEMQFLRIGKPGAEQVPVFAHWKDRIAVLNKQSMVPLKPGQNGVNDILWKEFKDGDSTVIASVLFDTGQGGCDMGANSSSSTQSWAADCPAKVVTITPDGQRSVRTGRACYQWFPVKSFDDPAEPDERTYAFYDAAKRTVTFRVTAKGKFARPCNREVRL